MKAGLLCCFLASSTVFNVVASQIHAAAYQGNLEEIRKLVREDPGVVSQTDSEGKTALHHAALKGHLEIVKFLLDNKADVNAVTKSGFTPAFLAKGANNSEGLKFLQAHGGIFSGANPRLSNRSNSAPASIGIDMPQPTVVTTELERSLIQFYLRTDTLLRHGTPEQKKQAMLAGVPSRPDVNMVFLKSSDRAWQLVQRQAAMLTAELESIARQPYSEPPIVKCEAVNPSAHIQMFREKKWINPEIPVFSLRVSTKDEVGLIGDFFYVNQHWVHMPGCGEVFLETP